MRRNHKVHVGCKDPNCLDKIEDVDTWDDISVAGSFSDETYSPCCGYCGCCPCGSWLCWECRAEKIPFKWWHSLTWALWGHRKWDKYLKSIAKEIKKQEKES